MSEEQFKVGHRYLVRNEYDYLAEIWVKARSGKYLKCRSRGEEEWFDPGEFVLVEDMGKVEGLCCECRHWSSGHEGYFGACRRRAPKPFRLVESQLEVAERDELLGMSRERDSYRWMLWPETGEDESCGEFELKEGQNERLEV